MRPGEEQTTASSMADSRPILVGVGQSISRWKGGEVGDAPSPLSLSIEAVHKAFEDTGARDAIAGRVDTLVAVRTLEDSVPKSPYPFGRCENYPGAVADAMELKPSTAIYSAVGGDQPQALVNEFASKLASGESRCVLLCGAEATAAYKAAVRSEQVLDWSSQSSLPTEDRGIGAPLSTREERKNGLGWPTNSYPLFEEAYRARKKLTRAEYLVEISELFAGFSEVASENPYAQYPSKRSGEYLGTRSAGNYPIAGPYLKWHVAQDAVNQGAALLLTTVSEARSAGIPEEKWVYLHGHSTLSDCHITERPDYSQSRSLEGTLAQALESSSLTADDIEYFDIYSCFPCVVLLAAEALGLDWRKRALTQTGGLPFFGGPGNNYSMHAIATLVEKLRSKRGAFGLVLANGGYLSKHAAGVYSTAAPEHWEAVDCSERQLEIDQVSVSSLGAIDDGVVVDGEVESFTLVHGREGVQYLTLVVRTGGSEEREGSEDGVGGRALVKIGDRQNKTLQAINAGEDPVGRPVLLRNVPAADTGGDDFPVFTLSEDIDFDQLFDQSTAMLVRVGSA